MIIGVDGSEAFVKNKTGVENYAFQILANLAKLDHKNSYLIYLDPRNNILEGQWPDNFKFKFLYWSVMWTQMGLALQTYLDHLDLLFIPGHTLPLLKNPLLKSVITVHDLGVEYLPAYHQWKQRLYLRLMTKYQIRFATRIIAVSEATKKDLIEKIGIKSNKIQVIYEALISRKVVKDDRQVSIFKQFDIQRKSYFLFVGTIQPRKNLVRLIEGFKIFLDRTDKDGRLMKLVLVGGKGWLSDEIYELPKNLGIEEQVVFTGRVNDQEVQVLYKNCLAVVYPSLFEGFGLPILDAFEANTPILTSNVSSMPEVAGEAAILVDPFSIKEIGMAMRDLYGNKKLREQLIKKGRQQLKKFSWEKSAQQTLELFKSCLHSQELGVG